MKIPNIFHFILISKDGKTPPILEYFHFIAMKSAYISNQPDLIKLYITKGLTPVGEYYARAVSEIPVLEIEEIEDFNTIYGNEICYFTHKTDVIRIQKLIQYGGIYLDLDTITIASFDALRYHKFVTCREDDSFRFGSAVLASEPNSTFAKEMINLYKNFRSKGRDEYFVETIQEQPFQLWKEKYQNSKEITIVSADELLSPKTLVEWKGNQIYFQRFFESDDFDIEGRYTLHLWTELTYQKYIKDLNKVLNQDTTYSKLVKRFLNA